MVGGYVQHIAVPLPTYHKTEYKQDLTLLTALEQDGYPGFGLSFHFCTFIHLIQAYDTHFVSEWIPMILQTIIPACWQCNDCAWVP